MIARIKTGSLLLLNHLLHKWLSNHGIKYILHDHPPVYTVEESRVHCHHIPGLHCKNLFLKDSRSKNYHLVTLPESKRVELKEIRKIIGAKKLSFASSSSLKAMLGLEPGAVSPFGLINDSDQQVTFHVDEDVWNADRTCFHPDNNAETLELEKEYFHKAIIAMKRRFHVISLRGLESGI